MAWSMHIDAKSLCMRKHTKCIYSTSQRDGMEHAYRCKVVMHAEAHKNASSASHGVEHEYRRKVVMHAKAQADRNQRRGAGVVEGNCKIAYVRSVRKLEDI